MKYLDLHLKNPFKKIVVIYLKKEYKHTRFLQEKKLPSVGKERAAKRSK